RRLRLERCGNRRGCRARFRDGDRRSRAHAPAPVAPRDLVGTKRSEAGKDGPPPIIRPLFRRRPLRDFAAPGAALRAAALDQLLEPLEVAAHAPCVEACGGADRFAGSFGPVAHRDADERPRLADRLERDRAAGLLAVLADPADLLVGVLLEDLRVPLRLLAGHG